MKNELFKVLIIASLMMFGLGVNVYAEMGDEDPNTLTLTRRTWYSTKYPLLYAVMTENIDEIKKNVNKYKDPFWRVAQKDDIAKALSLAQKKNKIEIIDLLKELKEIPPETKTQR